MRRFGIKSVGTMQAWMTRNAPGSHFTVLVMNQGIRNTTWRRDSMTYIYTREAERRAGTLRGRGTMRTWWTGHELGWIAEV